MIHETLLAAKDALEDSTLYLKWKRDNPREHARIEAYWADGGAFPVTVNPFGLMYALVAKAYHEALPRVIRVTAAGAAASVAVPDGADVSIFPLPAYARGSSSSAVFNPDLSLPFMPV